MSEGITVFLSPFFLGCAAGVILAYVSVAILVIIVKDQTAREKKAKGETDDKKGSRSN